MDFMSYIASTGFVHITFLNIVMMFIGALFIFLAVKHDWEPLLLIPIGFGMIAGNIPPIQGMLLGVYDKGSVLYYLYLGVTNGIYPPLIFLGIGCKNDPRDKKIRITSKPEIERFKNNVNFIEGVQVTSHSKIWKGVSKSNVLKHLLLSYQEPSRYLRNFKVNN